MNADFLAIHQITVGTFCSKSQILILTLATLKMNQSVMAAIRQGHKINH